MTAPTASILLLGLFTLSTANALTPDLDLASRHATETSSSFAAVNEASMLELWNVARPDEHDSRDTAFIVELSTDASHAAPVVLLHCALDDGETHCDRAPIVGNLPDILILDVPDDIDEENPSEPLDILNCVMVERDMAHCGRVPLVGSLPDIVVLEIPDEVSKAPLKLATCSQNDRDEATCNPVSSSEDVGDLDDIPIIDADREAATLILLWAL